MFKRNGIIDCSPGSIKVNEVKVNSQQARIGESQRKMDFFAKWQLLLLSYGSLEVNMGLFLLKVDVASTATDPFIQ